MRFQALLSMALSTYCGLVNSAVVPDLGTWTTSLVPRDINRDGIVDVYYDKNLNLTWLADFGLLPGVPWQTAELWARNFEIFGIAGWRLPIMTDLNYFNDLAGTSEFGSLYFTTLGNPLGGTLVNSGPFLNFSGSYWMGTQVVSLPPDLDAFFLDTRLNIIYHRDQRTSASATLVREGDIATIPEPSTGSMLALGLLALGLMVGQRRGLTVNPMRSRT